MSARFNRRLTQTAVRHWSFAVGASIRALWPPGPFLWDLRCAHGLQCGRGRFAEHPNPDHPPILRRRVRFVALNKCRRRHRRYVPSQAAGSRAVSLRGCALHGPCSWTHCWRVFGRDKGLEMGRGSDGHLYRGSLDHRRPHDPRNLRTCPSPQTGRRA